MIFDITISCMAADRQEARKDGIPPQNNIDVFLDSTYPDEVLDRIYNNKKEELPKKVLHILYIIYAILSIKTTAF